MLLVILAAMIGVSIVFIKLNDASGYRENYAGSVVVSLILSGILFIATIMTAIGVVRARVLPEIIDMYKTENAIIEGQIAEAVSQYQEYEKGIMIKVAPESAMTLIALYPDLKADQLVSTQIQTYVTNNAEIKRLQTESIATSASRWWLYFGK